MYILQKIGTVRAPISEKLGRLCAPPLEICVRKCGGAENVGVENAGV